MKKRSLALVAGVIAAGILVASAAAAVSFDPTCSLTPSNGTGACGFVGKGDVQSALGYNNGKMQTNAGNLAFTYSQAVSQAVSSSASQTATESVSQTVSCLQNAGPNTFTREGTRDGGRSGNRAGSRTGTQSGSVSAAIDYASRTHNQVDGFFLTAIGAGAFVASGTPIWGDATFGEWTWGTVNWGAWSPGDVHVCLGGNPNVTDLVDSGVVDGTTQYGAVQYGATQYGAATPTGPATLKVNGVSLG
jgi:hypothetical protein